MIKSRTNRNARKTDSRPATATQIETEAPTVVAVDAAVVKQEEAETVYPTTMQPSQTGTPSTQKAPTKLGVVVAMLRRMAVPPWPR